jgi:hypothetical protein
MKKLKILLLLLVLSTPVYAELDTTKLELGWNHYMMSGLTLTQVAFSDWATGGENSLAYNASLLGKSVDEGEMWRWTNNYKFAFGQSSLGDKGIRKTEDIIDLETIVAYKLNSYINPYAAVTFKTQFATGYDYFGDTLQVANSSFIDPAYSRQAIGIGYMPIPEIKTRVGAALRETFTDKYTKWSDDPATPEIEKTRVQGGVEWVTEVNTVLDDNIFFKSKLETFAPFNKLDKWVIYNDNIIDAKVSKLISVNLTVTIRYEEFVLPRTQIREGLAIGFSYQVL